MDGNYKGAEHTYVVRTLESLKTPAISKRYSLPENVKTMLRTMPEPFTNAYSTHTFLDKYSRWVYDAKGGRRKERWADTTIRCVEGTVEADLQFREDNGIEVDMDRMSEFATRSAYSMFRMEWTPPGRGLFCMGTDYIRERGAAALNNCYAVSPGDNIVKAMTWTADMLMCGGGVGMDTTWTGKLVEPNKLDNFTYVIPDTREGWASAIELLLRSYVPIDGEITNKFPLFDYSLVRPYGEPIKGFGGTSSGPEPLRQLLCRLEIFMDTHILYARHTNPSCILTMVDRLFEAEALGYKYASDYVPAKDSKEDPTPRGRLEQLKDEIRSQPNKTYGRTRLIADMLNSLGDCIAAGNVRRSAEILLGAPSDEEFRQLKNKTLNPEREPIMFASNNSMRFEKNEDFNKYLPGLAESIIQNNGEPGFFNLINARKYGRLGETKYGPDPGTLLNPCGETILCSYEPCTLAMICPMKCFILNEDGTYDIDWYRLNEATEFATWYATTVTTVKHHWQETRDIMSKNHRIGVSQAGVSNSYELLGPTKLVQMSESMYDTVRATNDRISAELGINRAIRTTVIKPDGTLGIIMECNNGVHFAIKRYARRNMILPKGSLMADVLRDAGYPIVQHKNQVNSWVVGFPIKSGCQRVASEVGIFEKFTLAALMQKYWTDNSVSFTGDIQMPMEEADVHNVLAGFANQVKAVSMLPVYDDNAKYDHLPFESITEEEYIAMASKIVALDFYQCFVEDAKEERGCNGDYCGLAASVEAMGCGSSGSSRSIAATDAIETF